MFLESFGGSHKDDALVADGGLDVRVGRFAVKLSFHAGKELAFLLGNS